MEFIWFSMGLTHNFHVKGGSKIFEVWKGTLEKFCAMIFFLHQAFQVFATSPLWKKYTVLGIFDKLIILSSFVCGLSISFCMNLCYILCLLYM